MNGICRKGFTLVEIVVVLFLLTIVSLIFGNIIMTAIISAYENQSINEARMVGEAVCDFFERELRFAADMEIGENSKSLPDSISMNAGLLKKNNENVYPADYYHDMVLSYKTDRIDDKILSVEITVGRKRGPSSIEELFKEVLTIRPVNMSLPESHNEITGTVTGNNLRIYYSK